MQRYLSQVDGVCASALVRRAVARALNPRFVFLYSFLLSGSAIPVHAASPGDSDTPLEEIVVTAQRRVEPLSKVPVAVSVLSGQALSDKVISDERDLQLAVPGLTVKAGITGNESYYAIRGQTLDAVSGSPAGVVTYLNEVAMSPNTEGPSAFYDMSSIQVLKGPQGTLFGRNATGGAVLYTTAPPTDEWGGFVTVRFGNYSKKEVQAAVNLPAVPGKLDIRLAVDFDDYDGYIKNIPTHTTLGDTDYKSGRATIRFTPTDDLQSTLMFQYDDNAGTALNDLLYNVYGIGQTNNGYALNDLAELAGQALGIDLKSFAALQAKAGYYTSFMPYTTPADSHSTFVENTTTYKLSQDIQLKNIAGYFNGDFMHGQDLDASPTLIVADVNPPQCTSIGGTGSGPCNGNQFNQHNWSDELQLQGRSFDEQLQWILGGYHGDARQLYNYPGHFGGLGPGYDYYDYDYSTHNRSNAVFAQTTTDLSRLTGISGLSVTVGGRESWEYIETTFYPGGIVPPGSQSKSEHKPSWQLGPNYQVTPELLIYAVTRGSWRAGGYTDGAPPLNSFGPETTRDYEIGTKFFGDLFGHEARLNLAIFEQITHDVQHVVYLTLPGSFPTAYTLNVPKGEVKGFELDGLYRPADWLTVGGAVSYTDATFPGNVPNINGQAGTPLVDYPDTPRWSGSLYADVTLATREHWGRLVYHVESYTQSGEFFSAYDGNIEPGTHFDGYTLVNMRLDMKNIMDTKLSVGFYAKNVLDRFYIAGGSAIGAGIGDNLIVPGQPRTFGVEMNYTF